MTIIAFDLCLNKSVMTSGPIFMSFFYVPQSKERIRGVRDDVLPNVKLKISQEISKRHFPTRNSSKNIALIEITLAGSSTSSHIIFRMISESINFKL